MAKKAGRSASPEELEELAVLLKESPDHAFLYEILLSLKGNQDHLELLTPREELVRHGWQDLSPRLKGEREGKTFPHLFVETERDEHSGVGDDDHIEVEDYTGKDDYEGKRRVTVRMRRWWMAAAVTICLLTGGALIYWKVQGNNGLAQHAVPEKPYNICAVAKNGAQTKLVLPDGTQVWLNAGSKLVYPSRFIGSRRDVALDGEAFFEVAKDPTAPFKLHAANGVTVGVLGTSFNVKAYYEDSNIETTLISGKVEVTLDDEPERRILLAPHEKLTIVKRTEKKPGSDEKQRLGKGDVKIPYAVSPAVKSTNALRYKVQDLPAVNSDNFKETAWLRHRLMVENEPFGHVARMLERRYDVHILFDNERLRQERISGVFEKENIEQVLKILKMTTRFNYNLQGDTIHLSRRATLNTN